MKRILINATQPEELRVAVVDGQKLLDLDLEIPSRGEKKGNLYKGRISRIEPSLDAVFVDYGTERNGFLPLRAIHPQYFRSGTTEGSSLRERLHEGQELVVQVDKEERGTKGAALTTYVSLAGRFLVLKPNDGRAAGVSRRIEGEEREELRRVLADLRLPEGMGVIVRTAGHGRTLEELQWDLDYLLQVWQSIHAAAEARPAPFLIYQEDSLLMRVLRDHMRADIGELVIDSPRLHEEARAFAAQVVPQYVERVKLYQDTTPLFMRYQIESQIAQAFQREVTLPSGGRITIDRTEALIAIDVNSARATKGGDIEETALQTNLQAAEEIARQLRIRDLGGLIVIDFIDMENPKNVRQVETALSEALELDRARVQVGRISRFGLLELSRQRLRSSLEESTQVVCPRCKGAGSIRSVESSAVQILRLIEEEALKESTARVVAYLPLEVATLFVNEKRHMLSAIEARYGTAIVIVPSPRLEVPDYRIERERVEDARETAPLDLLARASEPEPERARVSESPAPVARAPEPAVKSIPRATAAPTPPPRAAAGKAARPSLWARLRKLFASKAKETSPVPSRRPHAPVHRGSHAAQGEPRASGRRPGAASPRGRGGRGTENPRGETPRGETPRGAGGRERRPEGRRDGGPQETRRPEAPVVGASPAGVGTSGAESRDAGREGGGRSRRGRRGGRGRGGRGASSRPMSPLNGENMPLPGLNSSSPPPAPPAASPPKSETASAPSPAERSPAPRPSSQDEPLVQVETQTPARSPRDNGARATTPDLPPALRELYESGRGESSVPPPSES
jgi:ribonuclease E